MSTRFNLGHKLMFMFILVLIPQKQTSKHDLLFCLTEVWQTVFIPNSSCVEEMSAGETDGQ